jgi:hypothetical protein
VGLVKATFEESGLESMRRLKSNRNDGLAGQNNFLASYLRRVHQQKRAFASDSGINVAPATEM